MQGTQVITLYNLPLPIIGPLVVLPIVETTFFLYYLTNWKIKNHKKMLNNQASFARPYTNYRSNNSFQKWIDSKGRKFGYLWKFEILVPLVLMISCTDYRFKKWTRYMIISAGPYNGTFLSKKEHEPKSRALSRWKKPYNFRLSDGF